MGMDEREHEERKGHIGRTDESAEETIPGGVRRGDERVAGTQSESSGEGAADERVEGGDDEWPSGHRRGDHVSDDDIREAGESR
jgi:hypothetical protein